MDRRRLTPSELSHATRRANVLWPCASGEFKLSRVRLRRHTVYGVCTKTEGLMVRTGDTSELASVAAALDGAYGAWVNIDGFTVGEQREIYAGMRIFEIAKQTKSLRHYVWSSLDYILKVSELILPKLKKSECLLTSRCAERGL
jgi:hypothetical protein